MDDLLDIPMPFSAVCYPIAGVSALDIVPEHRNGGSDFRLDLPPGVSTVMATSNFRREVLLYQRKTHGPLEMIGVVPPKIDGGGEAFLPCRPMPPTTAAASISSSQVARHRPKSTKDSLRALRSFRSVRRSVPGRWSK